MKKSIRYLIYEKTFMRHSNNVQEIFEYKFSAPNRIQVFERILTESISDVINNKVKYKRSLNFIMGI